VIYELWNSATENSFLYVARDAKYEALMRSQQAITPDLVLLWTYDATSYFDAMRARNEHLGLEPYRPEPGWEDTLHPD
jgi:hypothetical protein